MYRENTVTNLSRLIHQRPQAMAILHGGRDYPHIRGNVRFYGTRYGVLVVAEVTGLPVADDPCENSIFGFHIHTGGGCGGTFDDEFADTLGHYDPYGCPHPYHAGDLPPLFGNNSGRAFSAFLTDRFTVEEILGRTVVIHSDPDDFVAQPSGNSGVKIACGVISK